METTLYTLRQCWDYLHYLNTQHKRQLLIALEKFDDEARYLGVQESCQHRDTLNRMLLNLAVTENEANDLVVRLKEIINESAAI